MKRRFPATRANRSLATTTPAKGTPMATLANRPPSYTKNQPAALVEVPPGPALEAMHLRPGINSYLRTYRMGECSIIVTREFDQWHLSIARPDRLPSWNEVAEARYRVVPDAVTMAMLLPPKAEYINIHNHCLQMMQVDRDRPIAG